MWLKEVDSTALQSSLRDLDKAYQNFFRRLKQGAGVIGFPKFKSKHNHRKSYDCRDFAKSKQWSMSQESPAFRPGELSTILRSHLESGLAKSKIALKDS